MTSSYRNLEHDRLSRQVTESDIEHINTVFESIRSRFTSLERRRPFVIEFAGIPKAGKSGVRNAIAHLAMKCQFRVLYPEEGASRPSQRALREDLTAFNAWTGMYALQNLLRACIPTNQYDLVMLDRGIFDAVCWMEMLRQENYIDEISATAAKAFFSLREWTRLLDLVVIFDCDDKTALMRETSSALAISRLERTMPLLAPLRRVYNNREILRSFENSGTAFLLVDTSGIKTTKKAVAMTIAEEIGMLLEDALDPRYVILPKNCIDFSGFVPETKVPLSKWQSAVEVEKKSMAETDTSAKQLVSYGFIEIKNTFLRLHRTGHANRPELKSRLSIGVGGHVEEKDLLLNETLENTLKKCLMRELEEELLMDEEPEVELCGFINDESNEAGKYHIAAVHRVRLRTGTLRVRQGVSDQEFGEGSWALVPKEKLAKEIERFDPWSQHIIHHCLDGPVPQLSKQQILSFKDQHSSKGKKRCQDELFE